MTPPYLRQGRLERIRLVAARPDTQRAGPFSRRQQLIRQKTERTLTIYSNMLEYNINISLADRCIADSEDAPR